MTPQSPTTPPSTVSRLPSTLSPAFTLMELMVVIAIIIVLVAILVPAISSAQRRTKITETTSEMTGLSNAIEQYYQAFNAYPGPALSANMNGGTNATTPTITGTQNLLLGLSYAMVLTTDKNFAAETAVKTTAGGMNYPSITTVNSAALAIGPPPPAPPVGVVVDLGTNATVNDYSNLTNDSLGNPQPRTYPAFYSFGSNKSELTQTTSTPTELQNSVMRFPAWGMAAKDIGAREASTPNPWNFPTILDRFPDPRPILYFRKTPGVDGTATFTTSTGLVNTPAAANNITTPLTPGGPALVALNPAVGPASYYLDDNYPYLNSNLETRSAYFQLELSPSSGVALSDFALAVSTKSGNNTLTARGGYVLISAGPDGLYGRARPNGSAAATASSWSTPTAVVTGAVAPPDDIYVVGGQ